MKVIHSNPSIPHRLMWFGTSPGHYTSLSIIGEKVNNYLRDEKKINLFWLGLQTAGNNNPNYLLSVGHSMNADDVFVRHIKNENIDTVITLHNDFDRNYHYIGNVAENLRLNYIVHATINSSPLNRNMIPNMSKASHIIVPSKFSLKVANDAGFKNVTYIPHAVDRNIFRPYNSIADLDREKNPIPFEGGLKEESKMVLGLKNKFIFGIVGVNHGGQKNFSAAINSYRILLKNVPELKDKTILWIHTDLTNPAGWDIKGDVDASGITDNVIFSKDFICGYEYSPTEMAKLYNLFDILLVPSMCESFHLPTLESMSCGTPVIAAGHSAILEQMEESNAGWILKKLKSVPVSGQTEHWLVDELEMAEYMYESIINKEKYKLFSENGIKYASQDKFKWENVLEQWYDIVIKILTSKVDYKNRELGI